jgi:hypothetical protein
MYRPETGYGFGGSTDGSTDGSNEDLASTVAELEKTVQGLQEQLDAMRQSTAGEEQS